MIDLRLALRSLIRTPAVTAVAVLSLALGLGANAAIFSLFEQMLLRPLPVTQPDRLVNVSAPGPKPGMQSTTSTGDMDAVFSHPMYRDLAASPAVGEDGPLTDLAAHRPFGANFAFRGTTASAQGLFVSGNYFSVLGLRPGAGRLIAPDDDQERGSGPVVVLSHATWRDRFGADENVLGDRLLVNGEPLTIVGVTPPSFHGTTLGDAPEIFVPLSMYPTLVRSWPDPLDERRAYWLYVFGRLVPDADAERAAVALNAVYRPIVRDVELPLQDGMSEAALQRFADKQLTVESGARGQSILHDDVETPLLVLLAVTGLVLLIAAANLANLLLVRASDRATEMAIRLSIGAKRFQIAAQLVAESMLLALAGCLAGLVVAWGTLRLVGSVLPTSSGLSLAFEPSPILAALLGALVLVIGLVGLVPALHGLRGGLVGALRGVSGQTSGSRSALRLRAAMVTLQIALSVALLASAGLFIRSLHNIARVDLGLAVESLATFAVSPELNGLEPEQSRALFQHLEQELASIPGVESVSASRVQLVANSNWGNSVVVEDYPREPGVDNHSNFNEVGPGFFDTVGMTILSGRGIAASDDLEAPKVAVVNESFAHKFGLDRDAVGRRMGLGGGPSAELDIEIVGLVADAAYSEVKDDVPPLFFLPYRQNEGIGSLNYYVRSGLAPEALLDPIRNTVARVAPDLPVEDLRTMEIQVAENVYLDRLLGLLSTAFAVVATLLAIIGLYGVLAYSVLQRRREIGLRMALGADASNVRGLVLGQVVRLLVVGAGVGLLGALALGRLAESLLFGLAGQDPLTLGAALAILTAVALTAGLLPARRASRIDPMRALREE